MRALLWAVLPWVIGVGQRGGARRAISSAMAQVEKIAKRLDPVAGHLLPGEAEADALAHL
jgi:hypothetical protein